MLYFATSPFLKQIQFPLLEILLLCSLEKTKQKENKKCHVQGDGLQCKVLGQFKKFTAIPLCENCSYSEFFWSVFSSIRTEYEEILSNIQSKCGNVQIRKTLNTDTFHTVHFIVDSSQTLKEHVFPIDFSIRKCLFQPIVYFSLFGIAISDMSCRFLKSDKTMEGKRRRFL